MSAKSSKPMQNVPTRRMVLNRCTSHRVKKNSDLTYEIKYSMVKNSKPERVFSNPQADEDNYPHALQLDVKLYK